jgi:hypothetical protein
MSLALAGIGLGAMYLGTRLAGLGADDDESAFVPAPPRRGQKTAHGSQAFSPGPLVSNASVIVCRDKEGFENVELVLKPEERDRAALRERRVRVHGKAVATDPLERDRAERMEDIKEAQTCQGFGVQGEFVGARGHIDKHGRRVTTEVSKAQAARDLDRTVKHLEKEERAAMRNRDAELMKKLNKREEGAFKNAVNAVLQAERKAVRTYAIAAGGTGKERENDIIHETLRPTREKTQALIQNASGAIRQSKECSDLLRQVRKAENEVGTFLGLMNRGDAMRMTVHFDTLTKLQTRLVKTREFAYRVCTQKGQAQTLRRPGHVLLPLPTVIMSGMITKLAREARAGTILEAEGVSVETHMGLKKSEQKVKRGFRKMKDEEGNEVLVPKLLVARGVPKVQMRSKARIDADSHLVRSSRLKRGEGPIVTRRRTPSGRVLVGGRERKPRDE